MRRGASLTRRLLTFAKRQPSLAESFSVRNVLTEFAELVKPTIEENVTIEINDGDQNLWVYCDVGQLENVMLNLVLNARDAILRSGSGDRIVVSVRSVAEIDSDGILGEETFHSYIAKGLRAEREVDLTRADGYSHRYVEFSVTDNGPGMDEEVKSRAVDPFFTTKESHSGSGLGLSMVYGFVQQADGELRIYSEVGHGTTVSMVLPRGTESGSREQPVERLPIARGEGQCILIVEDELEFLDVVGAVIKSLGYRILTAGSGADALKILLSDRKVDLMLTDVVMPGGIGGFDLAKKARTVKPELPVIYMSGYTGFSEAEMGDIVAPFIQKPSPPSILAETIKTTLVAEKEPM